MSITALPPAPSRNDPATFADRGDALLGALPAFVTEANALQSDVNAKQATASAAATTATDQATAAAASAAAAAASSNSIKWVSGTTYAIGDVRWSPANFASYRRKTAGAGTTDPSADATNWAPLAIASSAAMPVVNVSGTTQAAAAWNHYVLTGSACTLTLPSSPASGATVAVTVANGLYTNIIARNGQTIMGIAEDLTIDSICTVTLRFLNSSWRMV